jgi:hypothetical protein
MAKMFYTLDETKAALGRSEDEIKELAREGKLREFRDGPRLMFKTDQVEHLKADLAAGGDALQLAPDESDLGLADPSSSASGISLADSATGSRTGTRAGGTGAGGSTAAGAAAAEDTALAADLGLSGSVSGMPSSGKVAGSAAGLTGSHGSRAGIDAISTDESTEKVDPSAQTSIAPGLNADQVNIESVGSGSGLLDLTRESDDTSLGAELLDEIAPGASGVRRPPTESALSASALAGSSLGGSASGTGTGMGLADSRPGMPAARGAAAATVVEAPDPLAPAFGLAAVGAACVLLFAVYALVCGLSGDHPDILSRMGSSAQGGFSFLIVVAIVFALPIVLFVGGLLAGRARK